MLAIWRCFARSMFAKPRFCFSAISILDFSRFPTSCGHRLRCYDDVAMSLADRRTNTAYPLALILQAFSAWHQENQSPADGRLLSSWSHFIACRVAGELKVKKVSLTRVMISSTKWRT